MANAFLNLPPLMRVVFENDVNRLRQALRKCENINCQDSAGRSPLHIAAFHGNAEICDLLILSGGRTDKKDDSWRTPLHYACGLCHDDVVEILIRHSANVDHRDRSWQAALHYCAANNALQCAEYILPFSTDVNIGDKHRRTPLHFAAINGHMEMVDLLLRQKADVNARDKLERRPIHYAAAAGYLDVVKQLVASGGDLSAKDKEALTPLHCAAARGHTAICSFLMTEPNTVDVQAVDNRGDTCLHSSVINGKVAAAKLLLENGADVNTKNFAGMTPLHLAAASAEGNSCLELLIDYGAEICVHAKDGRTPLHMLSTYGRAKQAQLLIDNGADVSATDGDSDTALHIAARYGHDSLIKCLILNGADVNKLQLACYSGHLESVRTLLENGAFIFKVDSSGRGCLHYAAFCPRSAQTCLTYLIEKGGSVSAADDFGRLPLHYACLSQASDSVEVLLKSGSDINAVDINGRLPLHYAAQAKDTKCAFLLLNSGAITTWCDVNGWSPLHFASFSGHLALCDYLLAEKHGKSVDCILRRLPITPLHLAAYNGHSEIVELLLERTRRPDLRDQYGITALHYATYRGFIESVKALLRQSANCLAVDKVLKTTPLHIAASFNRQKILHLMISSFLNDPSMANAYDCRKKTPVMLSVSSRAESTLTYLLSLNPDLTLADSKHRNVIHRAAASDSEKIVADVLQHLESKQQLSAIFVPDHFGKTPFHYAAQKSNPGILAILLQYIPQQSSLQKPTDMGDTIGQTPLHWLCFNGVAGCVELLLDSRLTKYQADDHDVTPLHCAAHAGSESCCDVLIERLGKQYVDKADERGRTPLHLASMRGHMDCVKCLLNSDTNPNATDKRRMTALMFAASGGHSHIVEKLMEAGADWSAVDVLKRNSLYYACLHRKEETALAIMKSSSLEQIINSQDAQGKTVLHVAAKYGLTSVVEKLLLSGASVTVTDDNGHFAASSCATSDLVADCVTLILYAMFPDGCWNERMSEEFVRRTSSHKLGYDQKSRSGSEVQQTLKESVSASSNQSSDSEFF